MKLQLFASFVLALGGLGFVTACGAKTESGGSDVLAWKSCDQTKLGECRRFGGGEACYPKWCSNSSGAASSSESTSGFQATNLPSPNYSSRLGLRIDKIILHNTDGAYEGAVGWLRTPAAKASAHLVIARDGRIARLVADSQNAWHAGNAIANRTSLGIEVEAWSGAQGMTTVQEEALLRVMRSWSQRYGIPVSGYGIHRWYTWTDCPKWLWSTDSAFKSWREAKF